MLSTGRQGPWIVILFTISDPAFLRARLVVLSATHHLPVTMRSNNQANTLWFDALCIKYQDTSGNSSTEWSLTGGKFVIVAVVIVGR